MKWISHAAVVARLDLAEVVQSRWLYLHSVLYGGLTAILILVGFRESQVLGFTGMERVLLSLSNALVILLPLLALSGSIQVINRYSEDGTHEMLFSLPLTRWEYFTSITAVRYLMALLPLIILVCLLGLVSPMIAHGHIPWNYMGRTMAISASLLWCFVSIGLAVSTWERHRSRSLVYMLVIWMVGVALLDFLLLGLMLQWRIKPQTVFALAALNPVQCSRLALLSSSEPTLSVLGPVGFYLANRIGMNGLLTLGIIQPFIVGTIFWTLGWKSFRRRDLI